MDVYTCTEEELATIQKRHNATQETIERDVKILNEWVKSQPHFPETLQLENFCLKLLMHSKYDVEMVKQRIENWFTLKRKYVGFYDVFKDDKFILPSDNFGYCVPLPKLGPNLERLYAGKMNMRRIQDPERFDIDELFQTALFGVECIFFFEQIDRCSFIIDCEGFTHDHLKKVNFVKAFGMIDLFKNGYMTPFRRLHLFNAGTVVQYVISMMQTIIGPLKKKIHVHKDLESLQEYFTPEYLPIEFEGTNGSIDKITKRMDELHLEKRDYFIETVKYVADETKRTGPSSSTFGVDIFF